MKQIWSGSISFSLVTIPVVLYSAVKEHILGFKLLCAKCKTPITYERFCPHCKKEISWQNIVKGLKLPDDSYFIITPEKLKALKPEKMDEITIKEFVPLETIDIIYFEHHYYLAPAKTGQSSFTLLCKALSETQKAAIAVFVMRDKEYICAISPYKNGLLLTTLNYAYEIVPTKEVFEKVSSKKPAAADLKLAKQLITKRTVKEFDISPFKDTFAEKLKKAIKESKRKKPAKRITKKVSKATKESLTSSLKASLIRHKTTERTAIHAKKRQTKARRK